MDQFEPVFQLVKNGWNSAINLVKWNKNAIFENTANSKLRYARLTSGDGDKFSVFNILIGNFEKHLVVNCFFNNSHNFE